MNMYLCCSMNIQEKKDKSNEGCKSSIYACKQKQIRANVHPHRGGNTHKRHALILGNPESL